MLLEWERLYREALHEVDDEKTSEACERARRAINDRLTALAAQRIAGAAECEQLNEALRRLLLHEHKISLPT